MRESTATSTGMSSKDFDPYSWTGAISSGVENVDRSDSVRICPDAALAATLFALRKLITGSLI